MTSSTNTTDTTKAWKFRDSNQSESPDGLLGAGKGARRRNYTLASIGLLFILLSGLASYYLFTGAEEGTSVYAAKKDIREGDIVDLSSVDPVEIDVRGATVSVIPVSGLQLQDRSDGRSVVALRSIEKGALIAPSDLDFAGPDEYRSEQLGVVLEAGPYPSKGLELGRTVHVIRVSTQEGGASFVTTATVVDSVEEGETGPWFVTLEVSRSEAVEVADLASRGLIRLTVPEQN